MIQYALKCDHGHAFTSWFRSAEAFDKLSAAGHVVCDSCGRANVSKAVMAPRLAKAMAACGGHPQKPDPTNDTASKIAALRAHVEKNSDYVGGRFAKEARSMHLDGTPERSIYGEANLAEAKALIEDGVPIAPLPFIPSRKTN